MNITYWGNKKFTSPPDKNNIRSLDRGNLTFKGDQKSDGRLEDKSHVIPDGFIVPKSKIDNTSGRLESKSHIAPKGLVKPQKKHDPATDRLEDKSHITPQGALTYPKRSSKIQTTPKTIQLEDIPNSALIAKLNYVIKTSFVLPSQSPKDIKRAVIVNDQDFTCLKDTSVRHITGIHPGVPLRTDEFIVTDTKIEPIVPTKTGDLLFARDSLEFDQVNALVHATETTDMINDYWGIKVPWAFEGPIDLNAHARFRNDGTGEYLETWDNAYYARNYKEIALLIAENKREKGEVVYASRSSDTIAHETAHAKLDGLDKYLADSKYIPSESIHEAFADFNALLHSLCSDKVIDRILEQTKGDLRKDNLASQFDIQFGRKVLDKERSCLRNVLNTYTRPDKLSDLEYCPVDDELVLEPHNYSQMFTGTLYDILESVYKHNLRLNDNNQKLSLVKARDTVGRLFNRSLLYMPPSEVNFRDVAFAMLKVDRVENDGVNFSALAKSFMKRNILKKDEVQALVHQHHTFESLKLDAPKITGSIIEKFVDDNKAALGLGKDSKFNFYRCFVDSNGNQFFKLTKKHNLHIPDDRSKYYDLAKNDIPVRDGITLVFDIEGNLISSLNKELTTADKEEMLGTFEKFALFYYKPRQDGYDEIGEEWERRKKEREEARKKDQAKLNPPSTIHTFDI